MKTRAMWLLFPLLAACSDPSSSSNAKVALGPAPQTPAPGAELEAGAPGAPIDAGVRADVPVGVRDRAGRPLVFQLLASEANAALYNASMEAPYPIDANAIASGAQRSVGADFQHTLVKLDALDGTDDWNGGAADALPDPTGVWPHPLANAWVTDVLVVDPTMPFSPTGYLDIEEHPGLHTTCGGRWPGDDAIDKTLSFLIGGTTSGVSDGVAAATKPPTLTFPYLAAPN